MAAIYSDCVNSINPTVQNLYFMNQQKFESNHFQLAKAHISIRLARINIGFIKLDLLPRFYGKFLVSFVIEKLVCLFQMMQTMYCRKTNFHANPCQSMPMYANLCQCMPKEANVWPNFPNPVYSNRFLVEITNRPHSCSYKAYLCSYNWVQIKCNSSSQYNGHRHNIIYRMLIASNWKHRQQLLLKSKNGKPISLPARTQHSAQINQTGQWPLKAQIGSVQIQWNRKPKMVAQKKIIEPKGNNVCFVRVWQCVVCTWMWNVCFTRVRIG